MGIMHSEYRDRINHWIRTLKEDFYTPAGTLDWEAVSYTHLTLPTKLEV